MAVTYTAGVGDGARSGDTVTRIWQIIRKLWITLKNIGKREIVFQTMWMKD